MEQNKLEQEIQNLYSRTDKSIPYEQFAKIYRADKGNNFDAKIYRVAKAKELDKTPHIKFDEVPATSNLTAAQQTEFQARQKALGIKPVEKKEPVKLAAVNPKKEKFAKYSKLFGSKFAISEADFMKKTDAEIERFEYEVEFEMAIGVIKKPEGWTTPSEKKVEKLTLYQQMVKEKGWRDYRDI